VSLIKTYMLSYNVSMFLTEQALAKPQHCLPVRHMCINMQIWQSGRCYNLGRQNGM